jgi:hypothetical protein
VPPAAPPADGETAIGAGVSRSRHGYSRDILAFRSYDGKAVLLTVKAVLPERADLIAADLVIVSEADFRALFALPADVANDVAVFLAPGADPAAVRQMALGALPGARVVTRGEMLETADLFLDWRRGIGAVVILAMGLALVDRERRQAGRSRRGGAERDRNASGPGVERRGRVDREDLGVRRGLHVALGMGMLAAYIHVYAWDAALFAPVLTGWAVLAPRLDLVPSFDFPFLAAVAVSTIVLPASGTLLSSLRPASTDPDAAIRE